MQGFDLNSAAAAVEAIHHHQPQPQPQPQKMSYMNILPLYHMNNVANEYVANGVGMQELAAERQQANSSSCSSSAGGGKTRREDEEGGGWMVAMAMEGEGGGGRVKCRGRKGANSAGAKKKGNLAAAAEEERLGSGAVAAEMGGENAAKNHYHSSIQEQGSNMNSKYVRYSREQVEALERVYGQCPKPSLQQRLDLLRDFPSLRSVDPHQIKVWFQNRRCREKQRKESARLQSLNGKLTAMNTMLMDENVQLQQHVAHLLHENKLLRHQLHHLHETPPPSYLAHPNATQHNNHNERDASAPTTSLYPDPHILNISTRSPSSS